MAELRYADEDINSLRKLVLDKYGLTQDDSDTGRRIFLN